MSTFKLLLVWSVLCGALHAADAPKPASKPNILILLADDLGYGDPGCCRCWKASSPPTNPFARPL